MFVSISSPITSQRTLSCGSNPLSPKLIISYYLLSSLFLRRHISSKRCQHLSRNRKLCCPDVKPPSRNRAIETQADLMNPSWASQRAPFLYTVKHNNGSVYCPWFSELIKTWNLPAPPWEGRPGCEIQALVDCSWLIITSEGVPQTQARWNGAQFFVFVYVCQRGSINKIIEMNSLGRLRRLCSKK